MTRPNRPLFRGDGDREEVMVVVVVGDFRTGTTRVMRHGASKRTTILSLLLLVVDLLLPMTGTTTTTTKTWAVEGTNLSTTTTFPASTTTIDQNVRTLITVPLIPHHVQRARRGLSWNPTTDLDDHNMDTPRRRRTTAEAQQVGALYHGYGTHYIDLFCGTPPQRQTVIVDTGSGVTAFPCSGCKDCGYPDYHIDRYFTESESSSFETVGCNECSERGKCTSDHQQCRLGMLYQEGSSWNAYEARDICYVGGYHNVALTHDDGGTEDLDPGHAPAFGFPLKFGCQDKITGLFKTQLADGIMGMENAASSFWHQMYDAHKITAKGFSLCFSRPEEAERDGTEAGALTLGGSDTRLHTSPMVYSSNKGTSSASRGGFFDVHVRGMYMREPGGGTEALSENTNAKVVSISSEKELNIGGVIVDSGTTDTYWNSHIRQKLRSTFQELAGRPYNHDKLKLTWDELHQLPTILFQLSGDEEMNRKVAEEYGGGDPNKISGLAGDLDPDHPYDVILAFPPTHYMEGENGFYVNRMYDTESSGSVLGANSMINHDILFDADNGRIGWAESNCNVRQLLTDNGFADALAGPDDAGAAGGETNPEQPEPESEKEQDEVQEEVQEDEKAAMDKDKVEAEEQVDEVEEKAKEVEAASEEKKDEPSSDARSSASDIHDQTLPKDDIQKIRTGGCDDKCQHAMLVLLLFLSFSICVCLYRCRCSGRDKPSTTLYQGMPEVEMTNGNGRSNSFSSSYKDEDGFDDEPDDEDEYGGKVAFKDV